MNERAEKLIRDLADKLGTTAEHLWAVLLRQAPLTAGTQLVVLLVCVAVSILYTRWLLRLPRVAEGHADIDDMPLYLGRGTLYCFAFALWMFTLSDWSEFPMIVAGFFNPEYWALKQIIK